MKIWTRTDILEKMKLNEPGRQKLGRYILYISPVSRHSIQSYILTYYMLGKREPLGSHHGGL